MQQHDCLDAEINNLLQGKENKENMLEKLLKLKSSFWPGKYSKDLHFIVPDRSATA